MYLQVTPITIILWITTLISLYISFYLWQQRKSRGSITMMLMLLASALWAFSVGTESTLGTINERVLWSKISYFGVVLVGPLWFIFTLQYSQTAEKIIRKLNLIIWIIPIITLVLTLTNESHNLIWTGFTQMKESVVDGIIYHHGQYFLAHVVYTYFLLGTGSIILSNHFFKTSKSRRFQTMLLLIAVFIPWIANIIYVFIAPNIFEVELTPVAISISMVLLIFGVLKYQMLTVIPIAKESIFTHIENVIIILDPEGNVIDYNPFAKFIFKHLFVGINLNNSSEEELYFLPEILKEERDRSAYYHIESKRWFDAELISFNDDSGSNLGKMIYLHDISKLKKSATLSI